MPLDTTPLDRAATQLRETLAYARSGADRDDAKRREIFRAATVQTFACAYDLARRMPRRSLAETGDAAGDVAAASFERLIRTAYDRGLVRAEYAFRRAFRERRNIASRT